MGPHREWTQRSADLHGRYANISTINGRLIPETRSATGGGRYTRLHHRRLEGVSRKDVILDRTGLVLSDQSHATTRIRKINPTTIEVQMTIEDPKALTKPWVVTKPVSEAACGNPRV